MHLHHCLQGEGEHHPSHHPHEMSPAVEELHETAFLLHHSQDTLVLCHHHHPMRDHLHQGNPYAQVLFLLHHLQEETEVERLLLYLLLIVPEGRADPLFPQTLQRPECPASLLHHHLTPSMATNVLHRQPQMSGG